MITEQTWVADIATGSLAAVRVFMNHNIDFCCGGKRPLAEVCEKKGLAAEDLLHELEDALTEARKTETTDWNTAPLSALIKQILDRHHAYLRTELPRLSGWLQKVNRTYGQQDSAILAGLAETFEGLRTELETHLMKEEMMLFPHVLRFARAIEAGEPIPALPFTTFEGPLRCMEAEHDVAGAALARMREQTLNFTPPPHACTTYRALFAGLTELEADLMLHIHLENNILFRRVRALV